MKMIFAAAILVSAVAAQAATGPCGADQMVVMRVSRIAPGGTLAGFNEAVRDHKAWYASHGLKDDSFVTAPSLVGIRGAARPSTTEFVTVHVYGSEAEPVRDAAWAAYVAKYKANSTIGSETRFCLPKGAVIGK